MPPPGSLAWAGTGIKIKSNKPNRIKLFLAYLSLMTSSSCELDGVEHIPPKKPQLCTSMTQNNMPLNTFSCISCVDCASQNATVATSFNIGISTEQSRPSSRAISGRGCIGPFGIGPRLTAAITNNACNDYQHICNNNC